MLRAMLNQNSFYVVAVESKERENTLSYPLNGGIKIAPACASHVLHTFRVIEIRGGK